MLEVLGASLVICYFRSFLLTQAYYRSRRHDTTSINGIYQKDPKGWHVTFCYKDQNQIESKTHSACHGYVPSKDSFELVTSTHEGEKPDSTLKRNGQSVWPSEDELELAPEIGYSHLSGSAKS